MKNSKDSKTPRRSATPPSDASGAYTTAYTPATPESLGYSPPKKGQHSRKYIELPVTPADKQPPPGPTLDLEPLKGPIPEGAPDWALGAVPAKQE